MEMTIISFLFVLSMGFLCLSHALTLNVGGRDGWTLKPSEDYSHWSSRYRFQVNDTLVFKYKKGEDSVLVVNQDDYNNCNKNNPILNLTDGDSTFTFNRSGPFFFISGHSQNCENGQKLHTVVLSEKHRLSPPSPAINPPSTSPVPTQSPPPPAPNTPTPQIAPTLPPVVPSPSPEHETPDATHISNAPAPSPSPSAATGVEAPSVLIAGFILVVSTVIFVALA